MSLPHLPQLNQCFPHIDIKWVGCLKFISQPILAFFICIFLSVGGTDTIHNILTNRPSAVTAPIQATVNHTCSAEKHGEVEMSPYYISPVNAPTIMFNGGYWLGSDITSHPPTTTTGTHVHRYTVSQSVGNTELQTSSFTHSSILLSGIINKIVSD